jgi:NAD(P)H-hydrate epimerase
MASQLPAQAVEINEQLLTSLIPPRRRNSRKGENGVVLVVGGSNIYHGAPYLSSAAALISGVDLVYTAVPRIISGSIRSLDPNLIVYPLSDGKLTRGSANRLLRWLPTLNAAVIGPGMGRQDPSGMIALVKELSSRGVALVLDADALQEPVVAASRNTVCVITPHAGEFRRITAVELPDDLNEKGKAIMNSARKLGVTVLLKGMVDIVSDGNSLLFNRSGSAAMTVGGTGDVLAGLTGGILARNRDPLKAAAGSCYINGKAGEHAAEKLGLHLRATDLLDAIPHVMKSFDSLVD